MVILKFLEGSKMNKTVKIILSLLMLIVGKTYAQPYTLQSVGIAKSFSLDIYFGDKGKGAFVKYHGQKAIIALRIKNYSADNSGRTDGQPDLKTYVWDELVDGKINGTYGLTQDINSLKNIWYVRKKDGKRFKLQEIDSKGSKGNNQYLLHGALISFNHFDDHQLSIKYADGKFFNAGLPDFDSPNAVRQSTIADYNFDGYDDLAFSIPDAGMGVYREFSIFLFNPLSKHFDRLANPDFGKSKCASLCDVTLDPKKKLMFTACRGGARWWQDVYRYTSANKLVWVRSKEMDQ
ncbi:hypothetical protein [Pedobacter sp. Leaf250]|uniref:XAC2610-related protein n=1 Tax=Pedobacter sp. Leaf250 TaxID=2876559 RepID=UPI001E307307|nr:hypothetical protein [Pedobacter sp. Leaf250]